MLLSGKFLTSNSCSPLSADHCASERALIKLPCQVADRCGLDPGDLLAGEVRSCLTASWAATAGWTLRDAAAAGGLGVAMGTVTPEALARKDG